MEIFDIIRKQTNSLGLNASEQTEQTKALEECRANGFIPTNAYNLKRKELRDVVNFQFDTQTQVESPQTRNPQFDILANCRYYTNIQSNIKIPYLTAEDVHWGYVNPNESTINCSSVTLKPKQVSAYIDISTTIDVTNKGFSKDVENVLNNAIKDKVVETMFSDTNDEETPKGLFAYKQANAINEENIYQAILSVTTKKNNGTWYLSPSALIYLLRNHKDLFNDMLFDNGKLGGFDFIVDGRIQNDYAIFIDMSRVAVGDWTYNSITIDDKTKKIDGYIRVIAQSFVDFAPFTDEAFEVLKVESNDEP